MNFIDHPHSVGATGGSPVPIRSPSLDPFMPQDRRESSVHQTIQARATAGRPYGLNHSCKTNSYLPQRRSLRLKGYDYSQAGAYFVTMCAYDKKCLFGEVMNGEMRINESGIILVEEWEYSAKIRS